MNPRATEINIAEGPFSILGAYLNSGYEISRPNSIWVANCGSEYHNTIMYLCKEYGLLKVRINIWSDSEIKITKYQKLLSQLKPRLDIRSFVVRYNDKAEDFGHAAKDIKMKEVSLV